MKPLLGFLTIIIISAFGGMVTGVVWLKLLEGPSLRHEMWGPLLVLVGTSMVAVVGAIISARLTYGILTKVSYFEFSKTSPKGSLVAVTVVGILGVIGYVTMRWTPIAGALRHLLGGIP
jgi:hypothetical protein